MTTSRDLDIVLFGATGFTGGLVAEYLAENAPDGLRWALAGRSLSRLDAVRDGLGSADVELIQADARHALVLQLLDVGPGLLLGRGDGTFADVTAKAGKVTVGGTRSGTAPRAGGRTHAGLDFPVSYGTRVGAAAAGTTIFAGWNNGGYGNLVVIQHSTGYTTWYAHLQQITSWVGERVSAGTRIGYVGSTGYSTGPHLHFEIRRWNTPIDPLPYLSSSTAARAPVRMRCADPDAYKTARIDACRRAR
jgi:murein DD-endopeptidase MepM/ murein hydrolase activator NlpD